MEDPIQLPPEPPAEHTATFRWSEHLSWDSVGWYVALLIGLWGALMSSGDYGIANAVFILAAALFCIKWGYVTRITLRSRRLLLFIAGTLAAFTLVGIALHWTSGKVMEATKQRKQLAQLDGVPALQDQVKQIPVLQQQIDTLKRQNDIANSNLQAKQDIVERLARALTSQLSRAEINLSHNINQYREDTSTAVSKILRPGRTLGNKRAALIHELQKVGGGAHEVAISAARGSQECLAFANEIESAFREAGWRLTRTHFGLTIKDGEQLQITIKTGSNTLSGLTQNQLTVARAFNSIGMPLIGGEQDTMNNDWPVEIYVGLQ